ncbi:secreted protein containing DUF1566 [Candidatus Magnetobacterium bavaricum]|uniref:Secreted protein containing DUF1566 n=1 Tax=Candidatus Magnetobacterium bavaricum TaxID=29290 RepID=A0A0F3GWE9_9BACT|nr:secreted protein containing DUF1566 [Candidatus Magnetobacterium bavaricum]
MIDVVYALHNLIVQGQIKEIRRNQMRKVSYLLAVALLLMFVPTIALAATATPLQTGQKVCFNTTGTAEACSGGSIFGQDAYYRTGVFWNKSRFTLVTSGTTAGTLVDNTTGLVWPADPTSLPTTCGITTPGSAGVTWSNALLYVGCLNSYTSSGYLGVSTWRLPNIVELASLLNRGHGETADDFGTWLTAGSNTATTYNWTWLTGGGAAGNTLNNPFTAFKSTSLFWSSTSDNSSATAKANAWIVDMTTDKITTTVKSSSTSMYVLPVSGTTTVLPLTGQTKCYNSSGAEISCSGTGQDGEKLQGLALPTTRFSSTTASDGKTCISDSYTGLVWSGSDNSTTTLQGTWITAMSNIYALNAGSGYCGYTDWRMANVNEMRSLLDYGQDAQDAWLRTAGFGTSVMIPNTYWTSTFSDINNDGSRFVVDISQGVNGAVIPQAATSTSNYLMVRTGQFSISGTTSNSAHGTVSCSPSTVSGTTSSSTCTITPATGYKRDSSNGLLDNGVSATPTGDAAATQTYTLSNVSASHIVRGSFTLRKFTIKYAVSGTDRASTGGGYSAGCGGTAGTQFDALGTQTCQITLQSGFAIKTFTDNGVDKLSSLSGGTTYTMSNLLEDHTLAISYADSFSITTSVTGTGGTIACSPTSVASGGTSVCTAAPQSGYALATLTDNGTSVFSSVVGGTTYTISNITGAHSIVATFATSYTVTGTATGGNGTISCQSPVASGTTSSCTITPSAGYALQSLSDGGTDGLDSATATWDGTKYTYTTTAVTANRTVTVTFGQAFTITSSVTGSGGTITCSPSTVLSGQTATCTITPSSGQGILSLTDNGTEKKSLLTTSDNVTFTYTISSVSANHTVVVMFLTSYGITASVDAGTGTISCTPTNPTSGNTVTCTITVGSGQSFKKLTDNGADVTSSVTGTSPNLTYTINNVSSNHAIVASFTGVSTSYGIVYKGDFNGDGVSDILWINSSDNMVAVWFMGTGTYTTATSYGYTVSGWSVKAIADFSGDGKADILWQNTNGALAMWTTSSDGMSITPAYVTMSSVPMALSTSEWNLLGTGDFLGSGKKQIMWQNTSTGLVAIWTMNGTSITSTAVVSSSMPSTWQFKGIADFNGNGTDDVLWQNPSSGQIVMWIMNGTSIGTNSVVSTLGSEWTYKGAGSFDGGTNAGILWQSTSGQIVMWPMTGATVGTPAVVSTLDSSWVFKGLGKFNSGATVDILWQNTNGTVVTWLMTGSTITTPVSSEVIPSNWVIQ